MEAEKIAWEIKTFYELNLDELYALLKLRTDVFIVEQNCPYPELDEKDQEAIHLIGCFENKKELLFYCRIFIKKTSEESYGSIGRVVIHPKARGYLYGYSLMNQAIRILKDYNIRNISITAQAHLINFYNNCGFITRSKEYMLDGIPHVDMEKE
jgi:ElaA protein